MAARGARCATRCVDVVFAVAVWLEPALDDPVGLDREALNGTELEPVETDPGLVRRVDPPP